MRDKKYNVWMKLQKMQKLRAALGYPQNPFTERDMEDIMKRLKEKTSVYIKTGCFKFYLAKNEKSIVAEFNTKIRFALDAEGEK